MSKYLLIMNKKDEFLKSEGKALKLLKGGEFQVQIIVNEKKKIITASLAGKLRRRRKIIENSKVLLVISPYDFNRGQIIEILPN